MSNEYAKLSNGFWVRKYQGLGPYIFGSSGFALVGTSGATLYASAESFTKLDTGFWQRDLDGSGPYVQTAQGEFKLMATGGGGGGGGAVDSVNGQTGVVVLDAGDVGAATEAYADAKVADNLTASTTVAPSKTAVNTGLAAAAGTATWGGVSGTLASQTDLQAALDAKITNNAPVVLADGDFSSNNINLTQAAHFNRLIICDKTTAGTLTINTDATSGAVAGSGFVLLVRGAGTITITPGTGTVINATGATGGYTVQKNGVTTALRTATNTFTNVDRISSKFDFVNSSPSAICIIETGATTTTRFGQASTSELDSSTYVAASNSDGASPFTEMRRGRFQAAASAVNRVAGTGAGTSVLKIASLLNWPSLSLASIDDANANGSYFNCLTSAAPTTLTNTEPSAITTTRVGLHLDSGQSTLRMQAYGSGGASTITDLGSDFTRAQFVMFALAVWSDGTNVFAQAMNCNTGAVSAVFSYTGTTAPSTTVFLKPYVARSSLGTSFQAQLGWGGFYTGRWNGGRIGY